VGQRNRLASRLFGGCSDSPSSFRAREIISPHRTAPVGRNFVSPSRFAFVIGAVGTVAAVGIWRISAGLRLPDRLADGRDGSGRGIGRGAGQPKSEALACGASAPASLTRAHTRARVGRRIKQAVRAGSGIGRAMTPAGPYLVRYAQESAWREDRRRVDNGAQVRAAGLAMADTFASA
jgi:hypothetical protein